MDFVINRLVINPFRVDGGLESNLVNHLLPL
jgi:hypothetical protein